MSCPGASVLKGGACVPANCAAPISGLGVCLNDLAQLSTSRTTLGTSEERGKKLPVWVYAVLGVGIVLLIALIVTAVRYRAMKERAAKTTDFTRRKGLAGFIDLFRRQQQGSATSSAAASKAYENGDSGGGDKSLPIFQQHHTHNHIELQPAPAGFARSPIPPPYDYSQPPHPAFLKQQFMFPNSPSSESAYSHSGAESMYGRPLWPAFGTGKLKSERMPSPIHWPPHTRRDSSTSAQDRHANSQLLRPLFLRGSTSTSSLRSDRPPRATAERRYGSIGQTRQEFEEDSERQKTLDLLTGQHSRTSSSDRRAQSGVL